MRRRVSPTVRSGTVLAGLLLLTVSCSTSSSTTERVEPVERPTPSAVGPAGTPSASDAPKPGASPPVRLDDWEIGARTLPLRPDGFGEVRRTPPQLRVRRMPTVDALPPPPDARWRSSVRRIGPAVRERMGTSWQPGCPVPLRDLRYLRVTFWGFDRAPHTGELVVRADHARGVVGVFRTLYRARFPIEQLTLPTSAERDPTPSGDGNGSGATVCRATTGQSFYSAHAYGLALDLNPFQNPYQRDDLVIPERASSYLDRSWQRPGMIRPGGLVVRAFAEIGWSWGGDWQSLKDYQHFSATGR